MWLFFPWCHQKKEKGANGEKQYNSYALFFWQKILKNSLFLWIFQTPCMLSPAHALVHMHTTQALFSIPKVLHNPHLYNISAMWNTQYASKFGKLSSGHRTGKGQFSFQSLSKAMPNNAQTTTQMYSSHTKQSNAQNSLSHASTIHEPWTSRCSSWF